MNILGMIGFGQNPAACLLQDGKLVAFAEEERFTRVKGSDGSAPLKSVVYCLSMANLKLGDIDRIAFGWDSTRYPWAMTRNFGANYLRYYWAEKRSYHKQKDTSSMFTALETLMEFDPTQIRLKIMEGLHSVGLQGDIPKVEFVPHHLAHAYSAFFCSSFDKAGILTIDGSGEDICTQLAIGDGQQVRVIETFPIPHSLGWFYAAITEYLGFVPYRDEGKVMGLAALGEKRKSNNRWIEPLGHIVRTGNNHYEVNPIYTKFGGHYYGQRYTDEMAKLLMGIDPQAKPINYGEKVEIEGRLQNRYLLDIYIDLAYAAQTILERTAVMLAKKLVYQYKTENLCIAGGVGLNCKMNGEILRQSGCKNIFVQPASNDAGTALGAALYIASANHENVHCPLQHTYWGPGFSNAEILQTLKNCKLDFQEVNDPTTIAAHLLNEGKIIGWFQGRMEFGARALGNRSILANPVMLNIKDKLNAEVKYREAWRPFCPSIIDEVKETYIQNSNESSFMIVAYHVQEAVRDKIPSVIHVDGTIRPQVVSSISNPIYHSLLKEYGKFSGHPVVLNTSFNVRGEPIICTPLDAIRCFFSNGLDALVIGNFVLRKNRSLL